jgi:hypothetical protein
MMIGDELLQIMAALGQRVRLEPPQPAPPEPPRDLYGAPRSYEWARTAEGIAPCIGWPAIEELRGYSRSKPRVVVIWGNRSGIGKTAAALLLARGLAPDGIGYFVRCTEIVASLQEAGYGSTPDQLHRARGTRVLVLDDLGIEAATEANRAAMCDLVWRRADSERPGRCTIVTTSLGPDELTRRYGDGMTRRLHAQAALHLGSVTPRNTP